MARRRGSASRAGGAVLIVAAHPDDEVLGCGGTAAKLASERRDVHVLIMADGETSRSGSSEAPVDPAILRSRRNAAHHAARILGCATVDMLEFPDNRMDSAALLDVVNAIERLVDRYRPTMVFTHHAGDVNIDHRIVHDAVVAACRPQPKHPVRDLLFFEVASSTEWRPPNSSLAFVPSWFVDITGTLETKIAALKAYKAEMRSFPHPRSLSAITALARWRGATVGVDAAEAFVLGRHIAP